MGKARRVVFHYGKCNEILSRSDGNIEEAKELKSNLECTLEAHKFSSKLFEWRRARGTPASNLLGLAESSVCLDRDSTVFMSNVKGRQLLWRQHKRFADSLGATISSLPLNERQTTKASCIGGTKKLFRSWDSSLAHETRISVASPSRTKIPACYFGIGFPRSIKFSTESLSCATKWRLEYVLCKKLFLLLRSMVCLRRGHSASVCVEKQFLIIDL